MKTDTQPPEARASGLPIDALLPELETLYARAPRLIISAEPGAGKSTVLPLWLLERLPQAQRIVLVQPRRLAASAVARFMAGRLGEALGRQVALHTRTETRSSPQSRLSVVTSGVFLRMLQADPGLAGISHVLLDEFHERSWQQDLGLAFALDSQAAYRDPAAPLHVWLMSATPPTADLAGVFDAPVLHTAGRCYPVAIDYSPGAGAALPEAVEAAVRRVLAAGSRHILVFLPGWAEIRACEQRLDRSFGDQLEVLPLHGQLPDAAQREALAPAGARPRVVLATNVAQTSITIDGVDTVIDSGLARFARFDPGSGRDQLRLMPISRASAEQRAGRAGRTRPGLCIRLWDQEQQRRRPAHDEPELRQVDLAAPLLELAGWGALASPPALLELDPAQGRHQQAVELLVKLGAVRPGGALLPLGERMLALGLAPRLAAMVLQGAAPGTACWLAAALGETGARKSTSAVLGDWLLEQQDRPQVRRQARQLWSRLGHAGTPAWVRGELAASLLLAYPERLAHRRAGQPGSYLSRSGEVYVLASHSPLSGSEWLAVAELQGQRILLAEALDAREVEQRFEAALSERVNARFDPAVGAVLGRRQLCLDSIVLREQSVALSDQQALPVLMAALRERGWQDLDATGVVSDLLSRGRWAQAQGAALDIPDDQALAGTLEAWLSPFCAGCRRLDDLKRLDWRAIGQALLSWDTVRKIDALVPSHWRLPSGRQQRIDYGHPGGPLVEARVAEWFGLDEQPRLAGGVPLRIALLNPAGRPVQITADLPGFWRGAWQDVRKELRGRYPRHDWPEQPWLAAARMGTGRPKRPRH
ncbi:MAG TPA: ATP-dependent helicase HrpB [Spongiibacteraceae bacterium]|nr:ATP-dependent helicase HrpB [Spongiibacteraceae bacterium]